MNSSEFIEACKIQGERRLDLCEKGMKVLYSCRESDDTRAPFKDRTSTYKHCILFSIFEGQKGTGRKRLYGYPKEGNEYEG